ncbi:MAG: TetR/AcrR family transcriptional regulator [Hyphomicrobiaceae bacterium]
MSDDLKDLTKTNSGSVLTSEYPPFAAKYGDSPRDRLMAATCDLICRDGITATGVDKIVEAAGTAKTTLYKAFGSKDALVEAVLDVEGKAWRDWFLGELASHRGRPEVKLASMFKTLETWFKSDRFYGCPFINAVGESRKDNDRMREIAIRHKKVVLAAIESLAREAGAPNPSRLTHELALLMDGAIVVAMISKDPGSALAARRAAKTLIAREVVSKGALSEA